MPVEGQPVRVKGQAKGEVYEWHLEFYPSPEGGKKPRWVTRKKIKISNGENSRQTRSGAFQDWQIKNEK